MSGRVAPPVPWVACGDAERAGAGCGSVDAMASTWAELARPVLRPGLHVVRRDDRHLQIGLDAPDRLVLDDVPGLHDTLTHLDRRPCPELGPVVDRLVADGWVVEGRAARAAMPRPERPAVALSVSPTLEAPVTRACAVAGLTCTTGRAGGEAAAVHLVATLGEPRRSLGDGLVRDDVPHLWVAVLPDAVRLGPFVEPGRSACLRCVDAHLGDVDPRRATVLHQLDELPAPLQPDPDPSLLQLGLSWAVRDVVRRLDGQPPALRSATVTVTDDLEVTRRDWLRHPHCGCAWG